MGMAMSMGITENRGEDLAACLLKDRSVVIACP